MSEPWLQLAFAFGGGLGAVARHGVALAIVHRWPLATLLVNVLGSALLGVVLVALDGASPELRRAAIGFTGGFTTFSSFAYQTLDLHRRATLAHAAGNILASLLACVAAFALGGAMAARF